MIDYSKEVRVTLISIYGGDKYRHYLKKFNDERHFDNWVNLMERKGFKFQDVYQ
jgi:hypothetical protein